LTAIISSAKSNRHIFGINYETARNLARIEGIFGGITSRANVWAALQRAKVLGKGKKIVTVVCDSGLKYLKGDFIQLKIGFPRI